METKSKMAAVAAILDEGLMKTEKKSVFGGA
jgi:hypothetical protein